MIKYMCDICAKEIEEPEYPVTINCRIEKIHRNNQIVLLGESGDFIKIVCHEECAEPVKRIFKGMIPHFQEHSIRTGSLQGFMVKMEG